MTEQERKLQKNNREIMEALAAPYSPADLQEIAEQEGWDDAGN